MNAAKLVLLAAILTTLVSGQTADSVNAIPARVVRTAKLLGVQSQLSDLAELRSKPQHDELREMHLVQRLQGMAIASMLDVQSVNARIDYETARLQEVQGFLSARRDRRVNLLNVGNLLIGSGVGAVGSGLQLITTAQHAGNIVSTSAGFGGTILSVIGLQQQKGRLRAPGFTPAMLAKILGKAPQAGSDYPAVVWRYLTLPDPSLPRGEAGVQHLMYEWTSLGQIDSKPAEKVVSALTSTGKEGPALGIDVIGRRVAMLADVKAHVDAMDV